MRVTVRTPFLQAALTFSGSTVPGSEKLLLNAPHVRSVRTVPRFLSVFSAYLSPWMVRMLFSIETLRSCWVSPGTSQDTM